MHAFRLCLQHFCTGSTVVAELRTRSTCGESTDAKRSCQRIHIARPAAMCALSCTVPMLPRASTCPGQQSYY